MLRAIGGLAIGLLLASLRIAAVADNGLDAPASGDFFRDHNEALQAELQRYRTVAAAGGWPQVPNGPVLRPGAEDPRLGALAKRLAASGDSASAEATYSHYDESLEEAVRRFQERHGLAVDGVVGPATLRALNTPAERRIDQIRVNLERMRVLSAIDASDLILVNVPAFNAKVIRDGRIVWTTKTIVGQREDETPEFRSELRSVVFNPAWSVPHSIASEELLPEMKQDHGFFARGGYELHDRDGDRVDPAAVDWNSLSSGNFPFRLVQRPGPRNQLGQIKFMMPNPYAICMHDTPARAMFASTKRALSHGCIRIDDPLAMAEILLGAEGWTREGIESQIESAETRAVLLSNPLPVYVVYWTASVGASGKAHFYSDIYARDADILEMLNRHSLSRE